MVGLVCEMLELMWYGFGSEHWMMWAAGVIASVCSINYPAMSALVSSSADADKQGMNKPKGRLFTCSIFH